MGITVIIFLVVNVVLIVLVATGDLDISEFAIESGAFLLIVMLVFNIH
jgi:hypothetical protein